MPNSSRVKKTFLNARVNLFFFSLTLILSFFSRKIFLDILGADFMGLTGTLYNLLSFLNIAELGIGIAIGYVLYKPLFEDNRHKINEIISVFGFMYNKVGTIILIAGIILSFFIPLIFSNTQFDYLVIYLAYYAFLASSLIGYFINYRQTLLSADQKNYVVTVYFQSGNIIKVIIQMISAYYTSNYYLWIAIEFIFGIIYSFILNWKINKVYPWLKSEIKDGKVLLKKYPEIIKLTKQAFVHKLGGIVQFQATPFLVYAFVSLPMVAFYGNYTLLVDKIKQIIANVLSGSYASVGNLIAENNKKNTIKVYWELFALRIFLVGITAFALYNCIPEFISLWLGKEYLLSNTALILIITTFSLNIIRGTTDEFISGHGLFSDIYSPFIEIIIFLVSSLIGGYYWGLEGLLSGNIISTLIIIYGWKPYFLFSKGLKESVWKYWIIFIKYTFLTCISFSVTSLFIDLTKFELTTNSPWLNFILSSLYSVILISVIHFIVLYVGTKSMKILTRRILTYILK